MGSVRFSFPDNTMRRIRFRSANAQQGTLDGSRKTIPTDLHRRGRERISIVPASISPQ
jgi:hypothetical protein